MLGRKHRTLCGVSSLPLCWSRINTVLYSKHMKKKYNKNIQTVLDILKNEVDGDVRSALKKMTDDYTMTWVYLGRDGKKMFPSTSPNLKKELKEIYPIKGREYDIKNIAEGEGVVMVELIESYPDEKTQGFYRTPLVLVLEIKNGKIRTGRHYLDPRISQKKFSKSVVEKVYKNSKGSKIVIKQSPSSRSTMSAS